MVIMRSLKTTTGPVKEHFDVYNAIKKHGPITVVKLNEIIKIPKRTLEDQVKRLCDIGEVKRKEENSPEYVTIDFVKYEHLIKEQLKRMGKEKGHHISRDDVRDVAESLRIDYEDDEYIKSFNKAMKEMGLLRL